MFPVLILRSEFICLIVLLFLAYVSNKYNIDKKGQVFRRVIIFAVVHVVMDIITVITVNNIDSVPAWLNWICHAAFCISAILYSNEILNCIFSVCYPSSAKKQYIAGLIVAGLYTVSLPFLTLSYVQDGNTYTSTGLMPYIGFGIAYLFFLISLIITATHRKEIPVPVMSTLIPMIMVLIITETCQFFYKDLLFTGGAVTIATVGFFFSLSNPIEVFKQKAMTDALTGVQSRSSYEEKIEKLDAEFKKHPNGDYSFVFCDLNDLRGVNNRFGHTEGDEYITLIAASLKECMKSSNSIYRIGGDEFLIFYFKKTDKIIQDELQKLFDMCEQKSIGKKYHASVAFGFASSSESYKSLYDVVKTADYAMYQNKSAIKSGKAESLNGIKLDYTGLTDKFFDAMCVSTEKHYPFITNLDTNVSRISPKWKEYFGLEDEFYSDFLGMWSQRIHPDYLKGYMDDIVATLNGHQQYHRFDYPAKKADGTYVMVSCRGSVYVDNSTGTTYFSGYIVNHGLDANVDEVTGLDNYDILTADVYKLMDDEKEFSVLKLKLIKFARVNMLYGYDVGNEVIKDIAEYITQEIGDAGKVYCQNSVNFSVLFNSTDKQLIEDYYTRISIRLINGLKSSVDIIPIEISGGAYMVHEGEKPLLSNLRRGLVYAVEESEYNHNKSLVFFSNFS